MSRHRPPRPRIADRDDKLRTLAETIYTDYVERLKRPREEADVSPHCGVLDWLGYGDWIITSRGGYTSPETPRRRAKVLAQLDGTAYRAVAERTLQAIGWARPPARECEKRHEPLEMYCEVSRAPEFKGNPLRVKWGLRDTLAKALVFGAEYNRLQLRILDGERVVANVDPGEGADTHRKTFIEADDDDYRFEVGCTHSRGYPTMRMTWDWAEVDGVWKALDYQGYDWDGEWEGSTRRHGQPEAESGAVTLPAETAEWIRDRARRYGKSRTTGQHWQALADMAGPA